MNGKDYASYSFWLENSGDDLTPRPRLDGSIDVDVAVMGAGYTGLWTAYYLLCREPSLRVAVVEREIAGFGASGFRASSRGGSVTRNSSSTDVSRLTSAVKSTTLMPDW